MPTGQTHPQHTRQPLEHLNDYVCFKARLLCMALLISSGTTYPNEHYLSYNHFTLTHKAFLDALDYDSKKFGPWKKMQPQASSFFRLANNPLAINGSTKSNAGLTGTLSVTKPDLLPKASLSSRG